MQKAKKRDAAVAAAQPAAASGGPQPQPIIIQVFFAFFFAPVCTVHLQVQSPFKRKAEDDEPPPKRKQIEGKMDAFVAKGNKHNEFHRDVVKAFAACNIPLSKLEEGMCPRQPSAPGLLSGSPLRDLFLKYMRVDNQSIASGLVDPTNLRRTWLPAVHDEGATPQPFSLDAIFFAGIKLLQDKIRQGNFFFAIGVDETDDSRPSNGYVLTVELLLIPKVINADVDVEPEPFHLSLEFPPAVNTETTALCLDKVYDFFQSPLHVGAQVLRSFFIQPADVHYFVHDSASYMNPAAEKMRKDLGYTNMLDVPCWAHLLHRIGDVVFDKKLLPEATEYLRLTR